MLSSGELQIRNVHSNDSYVMYRCVTRNILTDEQKASDPAALYVIGNGISLSVNSLVIVHELSLFATQT